MIYMIKKFWIKKIKLLLLIIIFTWIISLLIIMTLSIKIKPILLATAKFEAEKVESSIINKAINEILDNGYDTNELFNTILSKDGKIQTIDFNTSKVNKLLSVLTMKVQEDLKMLEEGLVEDLGINNRNISSSKKLNLKKGVLVEVPIGALSSNTILADLGPRIPIKLHYLGEVNSNITTKIKEYGINNALLEIYANVEINAKVLLPFLTEKIILSSTTPIAIKVMQGSVPNYYSNGLSKDSSIYSIPFE